MSAQPILPPPVPSAPSSGLGVRVEYLDFRDVEKHREFRFRVYGADGSNEFRMRVANAAFDAGRVRMQDGPDLCYQKLLRATAAGVALDPDGTTIDDRDLFSYRDEHTVVPKRRAKTPLSPATSEDVEPRREPRYRPRTPRTVLPRLPAVPLVTDDVEPALEEGQRVNHAVFGMGVTTATTSARTAVSFDGAGPRTFVTSMLEVEVLSAPGTWETSPRGVNRPCHSVGEMADPRVEEPFDPLAPLRSS